MVKCHVARTQIRIQIRCSIPYSWYEQSNLCIMRSNGWDGNKKSTCQKQSVRFLVIGQLQNRCGDMLFLKEKNLCFFFWGQPVKYVIHCICRYWYQTTFPMCTKYGKYKRGLTNRANVHSIQQVWTSFHSNEKTKNADAMGLRRHARRPETEYFFLLPYWQNMHENVYG